MHVRIARKELTELLTAEAARRAGGEVKIRSMTIIDEDGVMHAVADCEASILVVEVTRAKHVAKTAPGA